MKKRIFAVLLSLSLFASSVSSGAAELTDESSTEVTTSENSGDDTASPASDNEVSVASVREESREYYPDSTSSNHTFVTKKAAYKSGTWMYLVPGKSVKFDIGDASGKKIKGANKYATWNVSGNSFISVKGGKVKVDKNATAVGPGVSANDIARGIVSAEYEGETIYIGVVAIKKTKYVGYLDDSARLRTNGKVTGKVGSTFDLRNLNNMIGKDVIASYKVEKSGVVKKYLYFATMEELLPQISMPKKSLSKAEVTYDQTGSIATFKPTTNGKYKVIYSLRDGSGKKFVLTIKAEN